MGSAIPVFKFAFAAYAAGGAAAMTLRRETQARVLDPPPPFLQNWRVFSSQGGLLVKIGVRDGECCEAVLAPKLQSDEYREIWLGEISETASAFSGVVRVTQTSFRYIRPGQRIRFDPTHILDWSIGCGPGEENVPSCKPTTPFDQIGP